MGRQPGWEGELERQRSRQEVGLRMPWWVNWQVEAQAWACNSWCLEAQPEEQAIRKQWAWVPRPSASA